MSLPGIEYRFKVPDTIDVWVEAEAQARGMDKTDVVREWLAEKAKQRAHAYRVANHRIRTNRIPVDDDGGSST